jgi:hypothetical protein
MNTTICSMRNFLLRIYYVKSKYKKAEPKEKQVAPHYKYLNFNLPYKKYLAENKNKNSYNPI